MESVNVRNLEQIQEEDRGSRGSRLGALLLASLGGAALVTVALVMALVLLRSFRRIVVT